MEVCRHVKNTTMSSLQFVDDQTALRKDNGESTIYNLVPRRLKGTCGD